MLRRLMVCGFASVLGFGSLALAGPTPAGYASSSSPKPTANAPAPRPLTGAAGPFTSVTTSVDLGCSVLGPDGVSEIYADTACGTFAAVDATLYGPADIPSGVSATGYTPISQTSSGAGSATEPLVITTKVAIGETGLTITQTDTWSGDNEVVTKDVVANPSAASQTVQLYRAMDCYVGGDDAGYGQYAADWMPPGAVGCQDTDGSGGPGAQVLEWIPTTAGSTAVEDGYGEVWADVDSQAPLPNTCQCDVAIDNGMGLSWGMAVGANGSKNVVSRLDLVPSPQACVGSSEFTSQLTVDSSVEIPTLTPGSSSFWTGTVHNPGDSAETCVSTHFTVDAGSLNSVYGSVSQGSGCTFTIISGSNASAVDCDLGTLDPGADATASVNIQTTGVQAPATITGTVDTSSTFLGGASATSQIDVVAPTPGVVDSDVPPNGTAVTDKTPSATADVIARMHLPKYVRAGFQGLRQTVPNATVLVLSSGARITMNRLAKETREDLCGTGGGLCQGDIIKLAQFDNYNDPRHPAVLSLVWDRSVIGTGLSSTLYMERDSNPGVANAVPACGQKVNYEFPVLPCFSRRFINTLGNLVFKVQILSSNDPVFTRR